MSEGKNFEMELWERIIIEEVWENTIEGVMYNIRTIGDIYVEETWDKLLIAKTLLKMPKEIRENVLEGALFVQVGVFFGLMSKEELTESEKMDVIAHEIAHFVLGDHMAEKRSDPYNEREAEDLIEKWGFKRGYVSYEQFEKGRKRRQ